MSDPTTPAVKGTQPPLSDPQPQRPVSDPRTIIADMLQVITSARRASIGGMQNVYCPQIHVDRVNEWRNALVDLDEEADRTRRAVSEAPAAPERVRTAPPQEDATLRDLRSSVAKEATKFRDEARRTSYEDRYANERAADSLEFVVSLIDAAMSRPSTPSSAPTTEEKP